MVFLVSTLESQTSDLPEQNQTDLLNGSVAEQSRGDAVDSDESSKTGLEVEATEITEVSYVSILLE